MNNKDEGENRIKNTHTNYLSQEKRLISMKGIN